MFKVSESEHCGEPKAGRTYVQLIGSLGGYAMENTYSIQRLRQKLSLLPLRKVEGIVKKIMVSEVSYIRVPSVI